MNTESDEEKSGTGDAALEKRLWTILDDPGYRPSKPRWIADRLELDADQRVTLRRIIKRLVRQHRLAWGERHLLRKAPAGPARGTTAESPAGEPGERSGRSETRPARAGEVIGVFRRAAAGYGFVVPQDSTVGDRSQDVFIPPGSSGDAVDRDVVRARLKQGRSGPQLRFTGVIVEVVERKRFRFVGSLIRKGKRDLVEVDGGLFDRPVPVGDASARSGRAGDKVVIEMLHFPSADSPGEAVLVEVLGARGQPGVDTLTIINQFGLPGEFPAEVLDDARRQAALFDESIQAGRVDLTGETIVTIDPATARDFDDAISLVQQEDGNWRLGVHIADVAHFVQPGSPLDEEALARGNSVYLPDRVIPMLPEMLSNGLASLQPERLRYTMSVFLTVDPAGRVLHTEWCRGAIRSVWRFHYGEIDDYLAQDEPWRERLPADVFRLVRDMHSLAMIMRRRRMKRGAIDLVLPEVEIDLDAEGAVCGAHVEINTESHQLIEEFMLAANEAVAQRLVDLGFVPLRRVHAAPSERKLRELTEFVRHVGIPCGDLRDRFELKRVVDAARDLPVRQAVHMAVLRSMQKAVYSPKAEGHHALGSEAYCHFTSPIRRYPDLVIHRMVGAILDGQRPRDDFAYLSRVGQQCSETEIRAEQAERELIKLKLINYLSSRIGMELDAVITGVEVFGVFVQGIELPAEGLVPLVHLPLDQYTFDALARTLAGRKAGNQFRLGDPMRVAVHSADPDRRELVFVPAGPRPPVRGRSTARKSSCRDSGRGGRPAEGMPDRKGSGRQSGKRPRRG